MDRIDVGVDGSPASTAAAVWAAGEAAMRDIELTIVHVLAAPTEACTCMDRATTALPADLTNAVVAQGVNIVDHTRVTVAKAVARQPPLSPASCVLAQSCQLCGNSPDKVHR